MKTEYSKMLDGELYNASDPLLLAMRIEARNRIAAYNQSPYDKDLRAAMLQRIFSKAGENVDVQAPFYFDYGCHIEVGDNFFANFNCIFLDCNYIRAGNNVFLGPGVQVYAAHHPVMAAKRIKGPELALPVTIGNNVWIGGGTIVCGGVTIGDNTTIGAGSVVVRSIPANTVAAGNPCKIIRHL